jgi:DNA-binding PadR family transcriptional regulator
MDASPQLSPALSHIKFYMLLALVREELHAYSLHAVATNEALGTVGMSIGRTYTAIKEMLRDGQIEEAGIVETGKHGKPRMTYRVAPEGMLRLKDDLKRMKHAVKIGEHAGLYFDELPSEIQRLLNNLR